ncbi:hypothetical protein [Microcoleus vaginatus]|uniref:hypothetical protein n=1 Tax=Microcoleus vaginatus TaxID=119532 RepID=UPI001F6216F7|nr:hypothetical protein D0A37_14750 [Microcoleus vaginatus HSN003]
MEYSDFTTLAKVRESFNLTVEEPLDLFSDIPEVQPSSYLQTTLTDNLSLATAINTEKARAELIIAPILLEVRRQFDFQVGFFSGSEFNVDVEAGLNGYCDYILTASKDSYEIRAPVTLTEAKNESIKSGLGQCIAEMVAAQLFNQRSGEQIESIYGAVTTGTDWKFLKLSNCTIFIDKRDFFINEISRILGILTMPFQGFYSMNRT